MWYPGWRTFLVPIHEAGKWAGLKKREQNNQKDAMFFVRKPQSHSAAACTLQLLMSGNSSGHPLESSPPGVSSPVYLSSGWILLPTWHRQASLSRDRQEISTGSWVISVHWETKHWSLHFYFPPLPVEPRESSAKSPDEKQEKINVKIRILDLTRALDRAEVWSLVSPRYRKLYVCAHQLLLLQRLCLYLVFIIFISWWFGGK